ncbi:protein-export membrane protein SecF [Candidatus Rickettsiella viridis]|uniref:Protein-export membrane protein SecF n=1 Tax=Candidatus Rickettsiella viridis TaxID=676208 RepID=A0A2Z5UX90_9COXI|nr:protein translocase subunit SecF [Candidatus Rickettsiella viridis]BBB15731.1 protein-export membrane protein SecF [Candidatus Rickettsiella viridis]
MEFFKKQTHIDFLGLQRWAATLSLILMLISVISLLTKGLHWGLDFTGGSQLQISFKHSVELPKIRHTLEQLGFKDALVQSYGTSQDVLISLADQKTTQHNLATQIIQAFPGAQLKQLEFIGPQVGRELATQGALAVFIALLGIMIYIALRFEYRFAIGAAVALIHDPILILGIFSLFHIEFNLTALAAILAVIGYSLNDTIVIFDRIRENFRKMRKNTAVEVVNLSINQTLSRTIMTSATTLFVVLSLCIFGGPMIHSFALALVIGIVVGTYSSIYVAGALAVALGLDRSNLLPTSKEVDSRP